MGRRLYPFWIATASVLTMASQFRQNYAYSGRRNCYQERWHKWNRDGRTECFACEKCLSSSSYHHPLWFLLCWLQSVVSGILGVGLLFVPLPNCQPKFPRHCFNCCPCECRCEIECRRCPRFCVVRSNCCASRVCCAPRVCYAEKNGRCIADIKDNYYMNLNPPPPAYQRNDHPRDPHGLLSSVHNPNRYRPSRDQRTENAPETSLRDKSQSSFSDFRSNTPTSSDTSRERSSVMSNLPGIHHILPLPGTPGTPYFRGAGCTNFLIYYEDMCEDYNVTEREQVRRLSRYCAEHISISIKGPKAYEERDWKGLKKAMLKQFREADPQQQMYTRAFLESLVSTSRIPAEVPQYSTQFLSVSKRLLD